MEQIKEAKEFVKDQGYKETPFKNEFTIDSVFLYRLIVDFYAEKMRNIEVIKKCKCSFDFGIDYVKTEVCNNCRKRKQ